MNNGIISFTLNGIPFVEHRDHALTRHDLYPVLDMSSEGISC